MFRCCASLLLILSLTTTAAAEAEQPVPTERVAAPEGASSANLSLKESTERGIELFRQGDYDGAIQAFTAAYVLSPKPLFLFNIAQAHRKAGRPKEALLAYQLFLRKAPDTPLRAETEAYMELARAQLELKGRSAPALVPTEPAPPPRPAGSAPRVPLYRRGWVWGIVGASVAAAAGIAIGLGLSTRPPGPTLGYVDPTF